MRRLLAAVLIGALLLGAAYANFGTFQLNNAPPGQFFPGTVTTRAIDGESMIAGAEPRTMTHTYYSSNGFTLAHNAGWDNASFFPIGPFEGRLDTTNTNAGNPINPNTPLVTTWLDLGWNHSFIVDGNYVDTVAQGNNITVDLSFSGGTTQNPNVAFGSEAIGIQAQDEPFAYTEVSTPISNASNTTYQNGRYWWVTGTHNNIQGGAPGGSPNNPNMTSYLFTGITTPNSTQRHLDAYGIDHYFFAGARCGDAGFQSQTAGLLNMQDFTLPTQAQMQRGSMYGDLIRGQRSNFYGGTTGTIPLFSVVEDGGPYACNTTLASYITPPEMQWAAWAGIIAGARGLIWFDNSATGPGCAVSCFNNMYQSFYQTLQTGNSVIVYNQVKATNAQIASFATQINSPFVDNYASVATPGTPISMPPKATSTTRQNPGDTFITIGAGVPSWVSNGMLVLDISNNGIPVGTTVTGKTSTTVNLSAALNANGVNNGDEIHFDGSSNFAAGVDLMAKYSGGKFYIFTITRNQESDTNISATYTVKDSGCTTETILDGRGGSIALSAPSGGNRTFTDTFSKASDVHIYRCD